MSQPPAPAPLEHRQAAFLAALPRIERQGRIAFRGLAGPQTRDDAVAEVVALCWRWFVRLVGRGKDPLACPVVLAGYAARHVRSGRRLCGQEKGNDALSRPAQRRHGFQVGALPPSTATPYGDLFGSVHGQRRQDLFEERLRDNAQTPVREQVAFRLDFPAWLATLSARQRRLVRAMARSERTLDLSRKFEVSPGRISQLRRELHDGWTRFCGDSVP
jgi:hypothetical protein